MADETILTITGIDIAPYSARGLTQTIQPIPSSGTLRRTINGTLVNVSETQLRKFASTISGTDQLSPALNGIWIGQTVTVGCIVEFSYLTASSPTLIRTPVSGSSRTEGAFTYYRPSMTMMVTDWQIKTDEYGAEVGWQLDLEEV